MSACPDANTLAAFMAGLSTERVRLVVEAHLDSCARCAAVLANAARAEVDTDEEAPARVGRYQLVSSIGEGAMGVVYEALDPTLERTLAVKLLRPSLAPEAGARLVAEAKALARLAHPNVVGVLDAGEQNGRYYIVMERVDGVALDQWLRSRPRRCAEVLAVFEQLAEGLAAVHDANLTHRDFKPANAMVSADGKATIIDFGLAYDRAPLAARNAPREVAGTYVYMAPEQRDGVAGAAADQYAFCVALHEALLGRLPNAPAAASSGAVIDAVPVWLRTVLARGLREHPLQRWPSMVALLEQLRAEAAEVDRSQRRLGALFSLLLWPFHLAINLLMLKLLLMPRGSVPVTEDVDAFTEFLAGTMATWFIGSFLTGWAPLGLVWIPLNAYGLLTRRSWAYRSTVIYFLFALPSVVGTPFAAYVFATLWRKAFPSKVARG